MLAFHLWPKVCGHSSLQCTFGLDFTAVGSLIPMIVDLNPIAQCYFRPGVDEVTRYFSKQKVSIQQCKEKKRKQKTTKNLIKKPHSVNCTLVNIQYYEYNFSSM